MGWDAGSSIMSVHVHRRRMGGFVHDSQFPFAWGNRFIRSQPALPVTHRLNPFMMCMPAG